MAQSLRARSPGLFPSGAPPGGVSRPPLPPPVGRGLSFWRPNAAVALDPADLSRVYWLHGQ